MHDCTPTSSPDPLQTLCFDEPLPGLNGRLEPGASWGTMADLGGHGNAWPSLALLIGRWDGNGLKPSYPRKLWNEAELKG